MNLKSAAVFVICLFGGPLLANAEEIGCVTTAWKLIGANHKVCVEAFHNPKVQGVTCHVSQAKTGGISGAFGVAQDPSQFSLACRQTGPIVLPPRLPKGRLDVAPADNLAIVQRDDAWAAGVNKIPEEAESFLAWRSLG